MEIEGEPLGLPDVPAGQYLIEALGEIGAVERSEDGTLAPLSWGTLADYAYCTDAIEEPWEFRAMRSMSQAYLNGLRLGEDPMNMPPSELDE